MIRLGDGKAREHMGRLLLGGLSLVALASCRDEARPARVYDLAHTLPVAEQRHEERHFDIGSAAARTAMLRGWSFNERGADGVDFAWSRGPVSVLEVFLLETRELTLRLRALAHPDLTEAGPLEVAVALNDRPLGVLEIGRELSELTLPVAAEVQQVGNNRLRLRPARVHDDDDRAIAVAVDWLVLEDPKLEDPTLGDRTLADPEPPTGAVVAGRGLRIPAGTQVAWPVELSPGQALLLEELTLEQGPRAALRLRVALEHGTRSEVLSTVELDTRRLLVELPIEEAVSAWLVLQTTPVGGASVGHEASVRVGRAWVVASR